MQQKQEELLNTQLNAENNPKANSTLIDIEDLGGTPFKLVNHKEHGWFLTLGDYRITKPTKTKADTIVQLDTNRWDIIFTMVCIAVEKINQFRELTEQEKTAIELAAGDALKSTFQKLTDEG